MSLFGFFSSNENSNPPQIPQPRLICLRGEKGTVACRVHDPSYTRMFPQRSPWGRPKYSLLSEEKMGNLTAVRGVPGAGMIGPGDYFCDLERSDKYAITIEISADGLPKFNQHAIVEQPNDRPLKKLEETQLTKVKAKWFSGFDQAALRQKMLEYKDKHNPLFSESIFSSSGLLEIEAPKEIKLPSFDPREIDLTEFKARLVANNEPFQITKERLYVDDEYCAVSYQYDPGHAERQIKERGGLFLEFHQFAQTITPLRRDAKGFVTLAKWNKEHTHLELIPIQIPYGFTLIIEKDCIHGDTTLNGLFMMCMTSDHISMATADTVFLKHADDKDNITLVLDNDIAESDSQHRPQDSDPFFFYNENKTESFALFKRRTQNREFVFSPFNLGYWEVKQEMVETVAFFMLAGASLLAAVILVDTMLLLSLGFFSATSVLAGIGLFRVLPSREDNLMVKNNALAI